MDRYVFFFIAFIMNAVYLFSFGNTDELFDLTLEELMSRQVKIGTLLEMRNSEKPSSVTTITSEDIKITPHRNIYDLLETYIPGLHFMTHYDSPNIGVRGIISDRNNKILIIINGKEANQKARSGAISELEHWDLDDIHMIEVIRGPGSVTYGPGGIACVINIITKNYESNDGNSVKVNYITPYNSQGISAKTSFRLSDEIVMFGFAGIQRTKGYSPERAYSIMNNNWTEETLNEHKIFQDYYADHFDLPQIKALLQFDLFENYKLWLRYGRTGSTANGAVYKSGYQIDLDSNNIPVMGNIKNPLSVGQEHFTLMIENEQPVSESYSIKSSVSYDVQNNARTMGWYWMWNENDAPPPKIYEELMDHRHIRNLYNNFSESELNAQSLLLGNVSDNFRFAAGASVSYYSWGAPLFQSSSNIRMGDYSNIISGRDSPVYGQSLYFGVDSARAIFVGDGWSTLSYSLFAETEYKLSEMLAALASFRLDKNTYSDYLLSPRLAVIYKLNEEHSLKFIAQQSNRMNTAEELFLENRAGNISKPEILNTFEIIYYGIYGGSLLFEASVYYNSMDVLSWYDPNRTTRRTGSLSLYGIEIDLKYKYKKIGIGLNHSTVRMLNWQLADDVEISGISYSDYKFTYLGNTVTGFGKNLNNMPNHQTKLFVNFDIIDQKLKLHLNTRIFWGFEGAKDGIKLVDNLSKGTDLESNINDIIGVMRRENFYETDLRLNIGVIYSIFNNFDVSLMLQNILRINPNWRYKYEAGNKTNEYFFRMNAIDEPMTLSIKGSYLL